jgi:hypothetical protein
MSRKTKERVAGRCDACGKEWVEHLGIIGTCELLQNERRMRIELEGEVMALREELAALKDLTDRTN